MTRSTPVAHAAVTPLRVHATDTGLAADTRVMTADGALPAAYLEVGDRIVTRRGMRKLRAIVRRRVPAGATRILLKRDALGGKPERDTLLMPSQRLLIRDWRAQALWGREIAAPPVARLVDNRLVKAVESDAAIIVSLYFGAPEVIYADGLELASADAIPARGGAVARRQDANT